MAQIESKILQQSKEHPDETLAVVVTVDENFDPKDAVEFGLKEIDAKLIYSGKLSGRDILSLSEQAGVLAIEPDITVSIA